MPCLGDPAFSTKQETSVGKLDQKTSLQGIKQQVSSRKFIFMHRERSEVVPRSPGAKRMNIQSSQFCKME